MIEPTVWPVEVAASLSAGLVALAVIGQIAVWTVHAVWVAFSD